MIRLRDVTAPVGAGEDEIKKLAARALKVRESDVLSVRIRRRSVDARRKPDVRMVYTLDVAVSGDEERVIARAGGKASPAADIPYIVPTPAKMPENRPIVVGFGPAGMFAALVLAMAGLRPLVLERGDDVDERTGKVRKFWSTGQLDENSNVQFGEGGAGTFSDGKLNTGVSDPRIPWIFQTMAECGASEDILIDARPHVGTDVLRTVVKNIRKRIIALGGEVRFRARVTGVEIDGGAVSAVTFGGGERIECSAVILAIGHSARDTVKTLYDAGVPMEPKAFSMGVRIEHRQSLIDEAQYGALSAELGLPPADYRLNCRFDDGSSAYTFCMCPGGYVVASASEDGGVVTNGMSNEAREGDNANSALLVTLTPDMFPDKSPLGGMYWQREIERRAFAAGGGGYRAPAQLSGDFMQRRPSAGPGDVEPTYRPGVTWTELHGVLPPVLTDTLEKAIPALGRKLRGFDDRNAVLTAPESRSSSPVRILRGSDLQSPAAAGLYPCGEGAGYAGGITSAAADGMRCAEAVIAALGRDR